MPVAAAAPAPPATELVSPAPISLLGLWSQIPANTGDEMNPAMSKKPAHFFIVIPNFEILLKQPTVCLVPVPLLHGLPWPFGFAKHTLLEINVPMAMEAFTPQPEA
jgi:hypothetical protein